jgi:hypothetical protein
MIEDKSFDSILNVELIIITSQIIDENWTVNCFHSLLIINFTIFLLIYIGFSQKTN